MPPLEVKVRTSVRSGILNKRKKLRIQDRERLNRSRLLASATDTAKNRAEEAYKEMVDSERLGDMVIVEKCYVILGVRRKEMILLFSALQQIINWEREERMLNYVKNPDRHHSMFSMSGHTSLPTHRSLPKAPQFGSVEEESSHDLATQRHELLTIVQHLVCLSPKQMRIDYPKRLRDYIEVSQDKFQLTLPVKKAPKISFTLPLPQVDAHWGFAKLLLKLGSDSLMNVLMLLLIERSVLVLGENSAEVTACSCALLELLQPFKWAGVFMPLLPISMLDFVNSPVPFVAGVVAKDPCHIEKDHRALEAIEEGLSVVNLNNGKLCISTEGNLEMLLNQCKEPTFTLLFHEQRLRRLAKDRSSALSSFHMFIQQGFSPQESVIIHSACVSIERHLRGMSGLVGRCRDGWRHYGKFNANSNNFEFYPSLFVEPLRAKLQFQEMMAQTQLFVGYVDKRRIDDLTEDSIRKVKGVYIANWIYTRWVAMGK
mmetsp:Transcript_15773/g.22653  ORF Transcript_15773/g.22653 Transcript_15773/m.22653 type:complete len:485 (+) Transcript_15773:387-1841(+)